MEEFEVAAGVHAKSNPSLIVMPSGIAVMASLGSKGNHLVNIMGVPPG